MKYLLLLWPLAGLVFWSIYQAKDFPQYPLGTIKMLAICLLAGPLSWLALLMSI